MVKSKETCRNIFELILFSFKKALNAYNMRSKLEVFLTVLILLNKTLTFPLDILSYRPYVNTFKNFSNRTKSRRYANMLFCFISHMFLLLNGAKKRLSCV